VAAIDERHSSVSFREQSEEPHSRSQAHAI